MLKTRRVTPSARHCNERRRFVAIACSVPCGAHPDSRRSGLALIRYPRPLLQESRRAVILRPSTSSGQADSESLPSCLLRFRRGRPEEKTLHSALTGVPLIGVLPDIDAAGGSWHMRFPPPWFFPCTPFPASTSSAPYGRRPLFKKEHGKGKTHPGGKRTAAFTF